MKSPVGDGGRPAATAGRLSGLSGASALLSIRTGAFGHVWPGGALMYAWIEQLAGAGQVRGGRDGFIHSLIRSATGPYMTKGAPF